MGVNVTGGMSREDGARCVFEVLCEMRPVRVIGEVRRVDMEFCVSSLTEARPDWGAVSSTPPIELAMLEVDSRRSCLYRETSCCAKLNLEERGLGDIAPGESGDSGAKLS